MNVDIKQTNQTKLNLAIVMPFRVNGWHLMQTIIKNSGKSYICKVIFSFFLQLTLCYHLSMKTNIKEEIQNVVNKF